MHQHDQDIDADAITVGYLDRFLGVIEKKFSAFVWCKLEMASIDDLAIPKHRIEYFLYRDELIWSKKLRIDKVFGSSNSNGENIADIIRRHAPYLPHDIQSTKKDHNDQILKKNGKNHTLKCLS